MASRFPFIERNRNLERKSREQEIEDLRRQLAVMGGPPLSQRIMDTGDGGNGRVEPNRPTHVLNTNFGPRTVHEGEQVQVEPQTGRFNVIPASQFGGQENLQRLEKATGMPGFQGGFIPMEGGAPALPVQGPTPGTLAPLGTPPPDENVTAGGIGVAAPQPQPISIPTPIVAPDENVTADGIGIARPAPQPIQVPTPVFQPPPTGVAVPTPQPIPTPTPPTALPVKDSPEAIAAGQLVPQMYDPFATRALQRLERYAEGRDPFAERIRGEERERFAGEAAAARGALGQELGQLGIGGREALTAQARLGRQIGADEATLMAQLRTQEAEQAFNAAMALPGAAASAEGQRIARDYFNLAKEQDDYKRMTDAFNALAEAGNFDEAAAMFGEMFPGSTIDLSKLQTEEARLDFSKGMENVSSYVASGLTWTEALDAMRQDGTFDLLGMDEGSVNSMYDALITSTDDVGRWLKSQDDPRLQAMFPDLGEEGGRDAIEGTLAKMHYFGAITIDENGKVTWDYDLLEEIGLAKPQAVTPTIFTKPGEVPQVTIESFRTTYGVEDASDGRIAQYLATNPATINSADFYQWDRRVADPARIESFLTGTGLEEGETPPTSLSEPDRQVVQGVISAFQTAPEERTEEQKALVQEYNYIAPIGTLPEADKDAWFQSGTYDNRRLDAIKGEPLQWILENRGKVVKIGANNYVIDAANPIFKRFDGKTNTYDDTILAYDPVNNRKVLLLPKIHDFNSWFEVYDSENVETKYPNEGFIA